MEVLRAAILLPAPFCELSEEARARLADRADDLGARLLSAETAISEERRRAREAEGQIFSARLDAADAEAALCRERRRARAEAGRLKARIEQLEAQVDERETTLCQKIRESEAALNSADCELAAARAQIAGLEDRTAQLAAEVAARPAVPPSVLRGCLAAAAGDRPLTHEARRTARRLLNKLLA